MPQLPKTPPAGAATSTLHYRVPFFDTDGMRIVHHANYVKYLELSRILYLDEHDAPYLDYTSQGLHYAVMALEVGYHQAARFDDLIDVTAWIERVRGASLVIGYIISREDELLITASTSHAMVDDSGRPVRIPKERRENLAKLVPNA